MIETINVINKEVAKELGIDEEKVKLVNKFFWKYGVKEAIQSCTYTSIRIKNLGTLVVSRNKVNMRIRKCIARIRELNTPGRPFKVKTKEQFMAEKYTELRLLLARRNDIAIAYRNNKIRSKDRYDKANTADMGEQAPHHAGGGIEDILLQ